jgi:hypothetical protein
MTTRPTYPVGIYQAIKAGSNFTGEVPMDGVTVLGPTFSDFMWKYAAGTKGGLFSPPSNDYNFESRDPIDIIGIEIAFGGQSSWSLSKVDVGGGSRLLYSGTTSTFLLTNQDQRIVLLWGQALSLVTAGASTAMQAVIMFEPHKAAWRV